MHRLVNSSITVSRRNFLPSGDLGSDVCSIHDAVIGPDAMGPARPPTDAGSVVAPPPATGGAWQIPASASFKISLSQDRLVQRQIRERLPKTALLLLQVLKTLGPVRTKAALFLAPAIVTLLRYAARATSLTNGLARRQGHLGIAQHADYLFRGVAFTAHFVLLARGQNAPHSLDKFGPLLGGHSSSSRRIASTVLRTLIGPKAIFAAFVNERRKACSGQGIRTRIPSTSSHREWLKTVSGESER